MVDHGRTNEQRNSQNADSFPLNEQNIVDAQVVLTLDHYRPHYSQQRSEALMLETKHFSHLVHELREQGFRSFPEDTRIAFWKFAKPIYGHILANAIDTSYAAVDCGVLLLSDASVQFQIGFDQRRRLSLVIRDSGEGIPHSTLDRLLEGKSSSSRPRGGPNMFLGKEGQGLRLLLEHVESYGGELVIDTWRSPDFCTRFHSMKDQNHQVHRTLTRRENEQSDSHRRGTAFVISVPLSALERADGRAA
ncbi:MAG: sensor histidine kinase [Bdellovibrionales bacterium]|nr:sensor histidine kinase [Bdellovibrionales bacterium]